MADESPSIQQPAAALSSDGLAKRFGRRLALKPTTFSIAEGEHLAITGPSGAGKTTLLLLLAGLLDPTQGEVREHGEVVSRPGKQQAAHLRSLGFLFQDLALWPHMTVRRHLRFALSRSFKSDPTRAEERLGQVLEQASLTGLADSLPTSLSGGERQRVAWARAIVSEPRILLLDEPLTSLDPALREELLGLTTAYGASAGRTLVVVTHDERVAGSIGKRILRL